MRTGRIALVVLTGADIGFRTVGRQGDKAVGEWVMRWKVDHDGAGVDIGRASN